MGTSLPPAAFGSSISPPWALCSRSLFLLEARGQEAPGLQGFALGPGAGGCAGSGISLRFLPSLPGKLNVAPGDVLGAWLDSVMLPNPNDWVHRKVHLCFSVLRPESSAAAPGSVPLLPGCVLALGTRHGDTQPCCCPALLPE